MNARMSWRYKDVENFFYPFQVKLNW